ncbi:capsular biosynthesis protein [Phormidesmis priestleyi ULC007]|uniref:non-specific protein-tyrosine kinase n=1 Tax=Phormidesmis priestleyi ULC007 TaxID=1920490 RepID=A0A2T1DNG3_9CYAN|nr:polysaccharide biosynthesis tyrosine autokinase [Phormidesmis priestleyi]PSB22033.1 capsular biosynthesis protein [Phormidesmis priestleyi ULC007]PZO54999.1 MAG: capsular biosynthesis protein [Phormidesmis priestleyi]
MTAAQPKLNLSAATDPGYGQLFAILKRHYLWVLAAGTVSVAIAFAYTLKQESTYISGMQFLVEPNYQGKNSGADPFTDATVEVDYATQISLMQSSNLLKKAMTLLQTEYPELDPDNPGSVGGFRGALTIVQVGTKKVDTKIFSITYTSNDPIKTQKVLQAVQKVYQDYNLQQQQDRLTRGLAFVDKQLPQVEGKVKDAEAALEQFRRDQSLIEPSAEAAAQTEMLNRLQADKQATLVQIRELQTRYGDLQQKVNLSPQQAVLTARLNQSGRYQAVLNEIQKTELAIQQQRVRFKENTLNMQPLLDQRQRQLKQLQLEASRLLGSSSPGSGESLLSTGQLGGFDQTLIGQFVETQGSLSTAQARYLSLLSSEQKVRAELQRFPQLLAQYERLKPDIELNRDTLKQLLKAQQDLGLEIARGGFAWQVVEQAQIGAKTGPNLQKNLMLGLVVGILLGGVAAVSREVLDDSVHSSDELKQQTAVPLLGTIPELSLGAMSGKPSLRLSGQTQALLPPITQLTKWRPFRESLDLLYQNLQLINATAELHSIVVTSTLAGEGKSTLSVGLAISAARLHQRVLLIDADLRRPNLHKLLNLPNEQGLSTLLVSQSPIPQQIETQDANLRGNISVLTAGPTPADPAKLLSSQRMKEIIATFEQTYDLVIVDAPPALGMVDAVLTASCCSGVLLVGRINQVTRPKLTQSIEMLNQLNLIGVVANGVSSPTVRETYYSAQD